MATLSEIKNQVHTIENITEEVFKYEMEISHLHENSEYYIIGYNKIYTSKGYNYILKNADGNFYWATPGTKNFIESSHYPPEFEIKTYSFYKLINEHGDIYLNEHKNPILELEADFKKCDKSKVYKPVEKPVDKNKVVDDYYVSSYIYGLKYSLDTKTETEDPKDLAGLKKPYTVEEIPLTDIRNKIYDIKNTLIKITETTNEIKEKSKIIKDIKDTLTKISESINEDNEFNEVIKMHIDNLEKYFKKYHEEHEIREDIKFRFDNLEKYVKEKYENETRCFIKLYINEENKEKLKIHLDNIEKYVIDYYEAEAKRILTYY